MNRSDFFKTAAVAIGTPVLLKEILELKEDEKVLIVKEPNRKKLAIDIRCLQGISGAPGGKKYSPHELLDIYFKTGILLYRSVDGNLNPVQVLEV